MTEKTSKWHDFLLVRDESCFSDNMKWMRQMPGKHYFFSIMYYFIDRETDKRLIFCLFDLLLYYSSSTIRARITKENWDLIKSVKRHSNRKPIWLALYLVNWS